MSAEISIKEYEYLALQEKMASLNVQEGFNLEKLNDNFRSKVRIIHPEVRPTSLTPEKEREQHEKWLVLLEAYQTLRPLAKMTEHGSFPYQKTAVKIKPLEMAELCATCKGHKAIPVQEFKSTTCITCKGSGLRKQPCKFCKDGKFIQKNGKEVECRVCKGSGAFFNPKWHSWQNFCVTCFGQGEFVKVVKSETEFKQCSPCSGKGKIEVKPFNACIKGLEGFKPAAK